MWNNCNALGDLLVRFQKNRSFQAKMIVMYKVEIAKMLYERVENEKNQLHFRFFARWGSTFDW